MPEPMTLAQARFGALHVCRGMTPLPQQGCPMPPQSWHVPTKPTRPLTQALPSRQLFGLQHGWPVPPQAEHFVMSVMRQEDCDAVHELRSQHGSPTLPQVAPAEFWHDPELQVPGNPGKGKPPGSAMLGNMPQVVPFGRH